MRQIEAKFVEPTSNTQIDRQTEWDREWEKEQEEAREKSLVEGKESKMNIYQHKRKINDQWIP